MHQTSSTKTNSNSAGKASAIVSIICAIHCMAVPLIAGVLPVLGLGFLESHTFEFVMIGSGVLLGSWSLWKSYSRDHRNALPFGIFAPGVILIALALFVFPHELEPVFVPIGAGLMGIAQWVNIRTQRKCESCAVA